MTVVKMLLAAGASPNCLLDDGAPVANGRPGSTPLHLAAMAHHLELTSILIDAGVDPRIMKPLMAGVSGDEKRMLDCIPPLAKEVGVDGERIVDSL